MRTRQLNVHCLSVSEGKHRTLFAPTAVHKTTCNTQQLYVQRRLLTELVIYRSRWPVQDIRHCVMFSYRYLVLATHCHTALKLSS